MRLLVAGAERRKRKGDRDSEGIISGIKMEKKFLYMYIFFFSS